MSAVRYFNDVPHIVRYGMQDDKNVKGWMLFWRNGVKFDISIDGADVQGTPFAKVWIERNKTPKTVGAVGLQWLDRWHDLCDCIISQSMKLLEELAPVKPYWTTLRDYLYTPWYELKMITSQSTGDAEPQIVSGPKINPAYELKPIPIDEVGPLPANLMVYTSDELTVIDREEDWRRPPHRVRAPDGRTYELKRIDKGTRWHDSDKIDNYSLDKVQVYIKLRMLFDRQDIAYPSRIPRMVGIVTDNGPIPDDERDDDRHKSPLTSSTAATKQQDANPAPQTLVVGILQDLFPDPRSRSIWDMVRDQKDDPSLTGWINSNSADWKTQTLAVVQDAHDKGLYWGGTEDGRLLFNINQYSVRTDGNNQVWLVPGIYHDSGFMALPYEGQEAVTTDDDVSRLERGKAADLKAVERLFEEWLPAEMSKVGRTAREIEGQEAKI